MNSKSLGNPYDGDSRLTHTKGCGCETCTVTSSAGEPTTDYQRQASMEKQIETMAMSPASATSASSELSPSFDNSENLIAFANAVIW